MNHGITDDQAAIDQFVNSRQSAGTRQTYNNTLGAWHRFLSLKPLAEITVNDMQMWRAWIDRKSNASIRREVSTVQSLFKYLLKVGYLKEDVTVMLAVPPAEDKLAERYLSESEVERLVIAAEGNLRDYCLIRFLYQTGARAAECAAVTWRDFVPTDDGRASVKIKGKGRKGRTVKIGEALWIDMQQLRKDMGGKIDDQAFGLADNFAVGYAVKCIARVAGLPHVTPHFFRHSAATHALNNGMALQDVSAELGHKEWKTTQKYVHLTARKSLAEYVKVG